MNKYKILYYGMTSAKVVTQVAFHSEKEICFFGWLKKETALHATHDPVALWIIKPKNTTPCPPQS